MIRTAPASSVKMAIGSKVPITPCRDRKIAVFARQIEFRRPRETRAVTGRSPRFKPEI